MRARLAVWWAVLAVAAGTGCGEKPLEHPGPDAFKALLEGRTFAGGGQPVAISAANITKFELVQVVAGPERKTASAVVAFVYAAGLESFAVDGVISYDVGPGGAIANPRFEVNEVKPY